MDERPHKAHRASQSGGKADKKKEKEQGKNKHEKGFNEKVHHIHFTHIINANYLHVLTNIPRCVGLRIQVRHPRRPTGPSHGRTQPNPSARPTRQPHSGRPPSTCHRRSRGPPRRGQVHPPQESRSEVHQADDVRGQGTGNGRSGQEAEVDVRGVQ
jgi:hypothetical protein